MTKFERKVTYNISKNLDFSYHFPPATSQSEQQYDTRITNMENTITQGLSQLVQINDTVQSFQFMTAYSSIQNQHKYYQSGLFASPQTPSYNEYTSWDFERSNLINVDYKQNLNNEDEYDN